MVDAILFVKINAVAIVHRVLVVLVAVMIVLDHVDMRLVIQPHALRVVLHPNVLLIALNLVIRCVHGEHVLVVPALVLVDALINVVTAKVTVCPVVLVPPMQVEQNYILSLKNSELKTS